MAFIWNNCISGENESIYVVRWKSLSLAFNRHETRDKWPLGRDLDRGWYHCHNNVKLFWSQPMAPCTLAASYECVASQSIDLWAAMKKALHSCGSDSSFYWGPNWTVACLKFHIGKAENVSPCSHIAYHDWMLTSWLQLLSEAEKLYIHIHSHLSKYEPCPVSCRRCITRQTKTWPVLLSSPTSLSICIFNV